jgi:hypothetical protein
MNESYFVEDLDVFFSKVDMMIEKNMLRGKKGIMLLSVKFLEPSWVELFENRYKHLKYSVTSKVCRLKNWDIIIEWNNTKK